MTFSAEVKEELSHRMPGARHCQLAELAAIAGMCADVCISAENRFSLRIRTENLPVARKCFTLLQKTFNISSDVCVCLHKNDERSTRIYTVWVRDHHETVRVLQGLKLLNEEGEVAEHVAPANSLLVQKSCCRRAFVRGAFLSAGSISNPLKSYHFAAYSR